jgi:hypothetical protein
LTENPDNEKELRAFLLGNLPDEARAGIEDRFLADEDFAARLELAEDELIESHLLGELSAEDDQRFRIAFLSQPRRRERVLAMKAVLAVAKAEAPGPVAPAPSFWSQLSAFLHFQSALAGVAVAAVVLLVMGLAALFAVNKLRLKSDGPIAQQSPGPIKPGVTASVSPISSPSTPLFEPSPSPTVTPAPRLSPQPLPETTADGPIIATIALQPSLVRDPSAAKRLILASSVKQVRLQLGLESNDFTGYSVRLTTVQGQLIWQVRSIRPTADSARASLFVTIPAARLSTDDYLVEVSGRSDTGSREVISSYFLTVTRK